MLTIRGQTVYWALEQACPFRAGENWQHPCRASRALRDLRELADDREKNILFEGLKVFGRHAADGSGRWFTHADKAYSIREFERPEEALSQAKAICASCPANAFRRAPEHVAGCVGSMFLPEDATLYDELLWKVIRDRGLETRLRELFLMTTPLLYGFWSNSPLSADQASALLELMQGSKLAKKEPEIDCLVDALQTAISTGMPLHVTLLPPVDNITGWFFDKYCPRCQVAVHWKDRNGNRQTVCRACGLAYERDPLRLEDVSDWFGRESDSSVEDESDFTVEDDSLDVRLGAENVRPFQRRYLKYQGCSDLQADEVTINADHDELHQRIKSVSNARYATLTKVRTERRAHATNSPLPERLALKIGGEVSIELVLIQAGEFRMGNDTGDGCSSLQASPQHRVVFARPFYMGTTPVTQAQWEAVMGSNPSRFPGEPDHPVEQVDWFAAQDFCETLSKKLGRSIRLPSEAEWEYACRAGTEDDFSFGRIWSPELANCLPVSGGRIGTTLVGSFPANRWGLFDMHGNVLEWCNDFVHASYQDSQFTTPTDGSSWVSVFPDNAYMIARGGCCEMPPDHCTSSRRFSTRANDSLCVGDGQMDHERCAGTIFSHGLRIVCDPPSTPPDPLFKETDEMVELLMSDL